jgi:predicted enzyme related to lactoylglutathione lyase
MAQGSIHGKFVWQELTTEDPATAVSFYSKVVGWHAHPNAAHPSYTEFGIGSSHSAGMMPLSDDSRAAGVRSHWLAYVGVSDVDASVASAQQLGAKVVHAAQDIEHVGRFATLTDPQGGTFAVFKPSGSGGGGAAASAPIPPGAFAWLELATSDYEAAFGFYSKLFGWQVIQRMDMGPQGVYLIFGSDGVQRGGIYKMHQERSAKPYWLPYAEVASADAAATAATAAGGRILVGPMDVPGGRMVQLIDPSGAMFAVHSAAAKAAAAPSKPSQPAAAPKPATPKPAAASPTAVPAAKVSTPAAAAPKPAAPKPPAAAPAAAARPAPKKAAAKKAPAKKKPAAKKKKAAAKKKPAAKKKSAARKKKAPARKSAAKSARKSAKKSAKKTAKKSAKKAAKKGARKAAGKKKAGKARRKK